MKKNKKHHGSDMLPLASQQIKRVCIIKKDSHYVKTWLLIKCKITEFGN